MANPLVAKIKTALNQETIISYTLAFVVLWFGLSEIFFTKDWVGFAPAFLGTGTLAYAAVVSHGVILALAGLMLVFNFHRRVAALVLVLIFTEIIVDLLLESIAADIIVRDIGLWGLSWALFAQPKSTM